MCSELECGVCYRLFNGGARCPRLLLCGHGFCESCLRALSQPCPVKHEPGRAIACPLCRHVTPLSAEGSLRTQLRVDECVLERLLVDGVLDLAEDEEDEPEVQEEEEDREQEGTAAQSSPEDSDSSSDSSGGRIRRSWSKVWRKIRSKSARRRAMNMNGDDITAFTMMAAWMF